MPFPPAVKARIFVKCARICCLCFKQCGTRIEAAHIVAEAEGGPPDDDNAIPICFDCHEEIGSYNPRHPKGNKFSIQELRERRDALYALVEKGVIQAQIVAHRFEGQRAAESHVALTEAVERQASRPHKPSAEAISLLEEAKKAFSPVETLPRKLGLLSREDRAFIVDNLLEEAVEGPAIGALMLLVARKGLSEQEQVVLEQLIRKITLRGDSQARARLMNLAPIDFLAQTDEELRSMFYEDAFEIMLRDQYADVNIITPAVVRSQAAIPPSLFRRYVESLFSQAHSNAWQGSPAAKSALASLPPEMTQIAFEILDATELFQKGHYEFARDFLDRHKDEWPNSRRSEYQDFLDLPIAKFAAKYLGWEEES